MSTNKDFYSMSVNELRQEYNESYDNPIKKAVIRQIIKEKYTEYKLSHNKKKNVSDSSNISSKSSASHIPHAQYVQNNNKKMKSSKRIVQRKKTPKHDIDYYEFTDDDFLDTVDRERETEHNTKSNARSRTDNIYNSTGVTDQSAYNRKMNDRTFELSDDDFNLFPNHGNLNELEQNDDVHDDSYKNVVENDYVNNNLMDRMNSEMEIRNKKNTQISNNESFISPYDTGGKKDLFDVYYNERTSKNFRNKGYKI